MNLIEYFKKETLALTVFPTTFAIMIAITRVDMYNMILVWIIGIVAFFTYMVIRWAFFDRTRNLGTSVTEYWMDEKRGSYTHGSR